jgi:pyrroloquinoline quinone biosynthesis protein B
VRLILLGSAAGGGFPQWNCACSNCRQAWAGDPKARHRTQASLAASSGNGRWLLVNASPDLLTQIIRTPALHPVGLRDSPIAAVLLTSGEIDNIAGLLSLRERQSFGLLATPRVQKILARNSVFDALDPALVRRQPLRPEETVEVAGLRVTLFPVPGKPPLYLEGAAASEDEEDTVALELTGSDGRRAYYVPGCHHVTPALCARMAGAEAIFFDGTVWTDDELRSAGVGIKTGRRMGHQPLSGPDGSLASLRGVTARRKILVHINNTNPLLIEDAPEREVAAAEGWEIGHDGMELAL